MVKYATLWYRFQRDKDGKESWNFNHLEDDHCPNDIPTAKVEEHKQVWKGKWKKEFVYLIPNAEGVDQIIRKDLK